MANESNGLSIFGVPVVALERLGNTALLVIVLGFGAWIWQNHFEEQAALWSQVRELMAEDLQNDKKLLETWQSVSATLMANKEMTSELLAQVREDDKEMRTRIRAIEIRVGVAPPPTHE